MNTKRSTAFAALCAAAILAPSDLAAGVRLAQGELNARATVQIAETSRVSPRADSSSDVIYTFTPALVYRRDVGRIDFNADLRVPIRRYDTADRLDSNSIDFSMSGNMPYGTGPRLSGSWNASYFEGVTASFLTNRNLDSRRIAASINSDYRLRNKLSARTRLGYNDRSNSGVDSSFRNENQTTFLAAGLHAREILGRVGVYTEYVVQKRETNFGSINEGVNTTDDGINFGVTGQILPERLFPKLEADLSFGYTSTEGGDRVGTSGRRNRLRLDGSLRYPMNPRTNVALTFNRNLLVTDDDRTVEQTRMELSAQYTPGQRLAFDAGIGLQDNDFLYADNRRQDDVLTFRLGARYVIRPNWSAALDYNMRETDSNVSISDYSSSVISLSTTISY